MGAVKYIVVTDKPKMIKVQDDRLVISAQDFINKGDSYIRKGSKVQPKVINLSNHYDYLSKGYYVSLLAEARGMPCVPNVSHIVSVNWKRNYDYALPELTALLLKNFDEPVSEPLSRSYTTYFGRHNNPKLEPLTRRLFDLFRFPIISFDVKVSSKGGWVIDKVETPSFTALPEICMGAFAEALDKFTGSAWQKDAKKKAERYWIAILHDPEEAYAPSDKAALKKFISIGKKMGLWVELITRADYASLLEYDALLIRETTAINNHTYRFANKAESEDIPCIDDTRSIIRCCNKVYLKELMDTHGVATPKTVILDRKALAKIGEMPIEYPAVLKIPDGSFSRGVKKVKNPDELEFQASEMLRKSEIILCQEFLESQFDWRIGVINNEIIFAIKYYMAKGHWQIYNHDAKSKGQVSGAHECVAIEDIPEDVSSIALKATKLIGDGLYGVDLKQCADGRVVVIEVNDNPNIDHGIEDSLIGDELYKKILEHLVRMIEA
ncbi:MAG: RimK family alpha-L-glutamate ligase [Micavibrio sp.]|nr:RimK family alpha-L-glutamate ligase [Micavibrio sp.]|tara:strand:- start:1180 stop:2664 length:1485 start_codon:yes stop_codon:yes gene_type:complete